MEIDDLRRAIAPSLAPSPRKLAKSAFDDRFDAAFRREKQVLEKQKSAFAHQAQVQQILMSQVSNVSNAILPFSARNRKIQFFQ